MTAPKRIQMTRQHPWRANNPNAIIVARPSRWGNPYVVHVHTDRCDDAHYGCPDHPADTRRGAVTLFRHAVLWPLENQPAVPTPDEIRAALAGHDLACWCPLVDSDGTPVPCHGDVLLDIANGSAS